MDDANELRRILRQAISCMIQTQPDGYGQVLRILSEASENPEIEELANRAYRDELLEVLEEKPALGGVH